MRSATTILLTTAAATSTLLTGASAAAAPCSAPAVTVLTPAQTPLSSWAENLGYDDAKQLWVSRLRGGVVERLNRLGHPVARVTVADPGAVRRGPGGHMFVASGTSSTNLLPGAARTSRILRFDPTAAHPVARTFARGLVMPNGMVFDDAGALYVADSAQGILRLRRDGTLDQTWAAKTKAAVAPLINGFGPNGITLVGDTLYVTLTTSLTGRVLRIPTRNPASASALDLTTPIPGTLDDLATLSGDRLAVTTATGQLLVVNLRSRRTCAYSLGQPLTAVAVSPDDPKRLTVATELGDLLAVRLAS